jgi:bacterioferritin
MSMPLPDRAEEIRLLNQDLYGEHDAIAHYLQHAWALADSYGPSIERIARDEMRHLKWLAHTIVAKGGVPDLSMPAVTPPLSGPDLFRSDVEAEETAIAQYQAHRRRIQDPAVDGLLGRILVDEEDHRRQFLGMAAQFDQASWHMVTGGDPDPVAERLQQVIAIEYAVVLQSLWRSFLERHRGTLADDWEERAIDEMKHLGWMGEALAARGVWARFPDQVAVRADPEAMEAREAALYADLEAWATTAAPEWLPLVQRIRRRETYLRAALDRTGTGFTVGPLLREEGRA